MKKLFSLFICLIMALSLFGCGNANNNDASDTLVLNQYNDVIINYLKTKDESEIATLLRTYGGYSYDEQQIKLKWDMIDGNETYVITIGTKSDLSDGKNYETFINSYKPCALYPNTTYYYKVTSYDRDSNILFESEITKFKTEDYNLRQVNISGVYNVRDLGGWKTEDGKTVAYDKLYRGGRLNEITEIGEETMENELGVKTEIDLRYDGSQEHKFQNVFYYKCGMSQYTTIIPYYVSPALTDYPTVTHSYDSGSTTSIKKIFTLLSKEENYPVYFHCNAGADRTGTLAYLINGLLGVSYDDLVKDFELTSFSKYGIRARSAIVNGKFDDSGIYQNDTDNYIAFGKLNDLMITEYGTSDGKLSSAIENYLINVCKVQQSEIDSIRKIMLG